MVLDDQNKIVTLPSYSFAALVYPERSEGSPVAQLESSKWLRQCADFSCATGDASLRSA
jgi:hypothetical protein